MINSKAYYLETFKIQESQLDELVGAALSSGGGYADLYFQNTAQQDLMLRDGAVSSGGFHVDYGVGIRTLCGEKTGYAYSESTDMPSMMSAAKAAAAICAGRGSKPGQPGTDAGANATGNTGPAAATGGSKAQAMRNIREARSTGAIYTRQESNGGRLVRKLYPGEPNPLADRYPMKEDWRTSDVKAFIPKLLKIKELIEQKDSRAIKISISMSSSVTDLLMYNSFSELKYDTKPVATIVAVAVFSNGKEVETQSVSRSHRAGAELITDAFLEEIADAVVKGIDERFEARRPKGGRMPVVMAAGASGILLHEAMGHAFEADFNRKNQSVFSDKMGSRICRKGINIVDDGTIKGDRGALNFDDEGVPGQRTMMVEDGVLTSYLHDRISARFYGTSPTGNGRRESFRFNPIPRMRSTYMEDGTDEPEGIIASVKNGIYVSDFSNGEVNIGQGDFTFYVKSGFLIENGRLTQPVKDINIIGNGPAALADICAVGNDGFVDPGAWTCGKGQSVSVSCGIPTVLVKELTVGGE